MKKLWQAWDQFWFFPQNLLGLACMRIMLCGSMVYLYVIRFFNLEYFSDSSWVNRADALKIIPEVFRPYFLWSFWPDSWNLVTHSLLVILLVLLTLGVGGRWIMWLAWVINIGFIQRNYSVIFGADVIANLFLFYMSFTQSCERLSVLTFFKKRKAVKDSDILTSVMIRMMQIQISVIYVYTGWEKLKGALWWDGSALWNVLAQPQIMTMDFIFMRNFSWLIPVLTYATLIFEIYFPVMVAWPKMRLIWLLVGTLFHAFIGIFMGLGPFATVMISTYFLFFDPHLLVKKIKAKTIF